MANRIKELREKAGMSQERLAEAIQTGRSQIVKLERGERRLTVDWMIRIAKALDVSPKELMPSSEDMPATPEVTSGLAQILSDMPASLGASPIDFGAADLPIYGKAEGGPSGVLMMPEHQAPIGWTFRPPQLRGVDDAFAVLVAGDSMRPMYKPGQTLWVHPYLPLVAGEGVLIIKRTDEVFIKEFVSGNDDTITVQEYKPRERKFKVARSEIRQAYRIVGAHSMR